MMYEQFKEFIEGTKIQISEVDMMKIYYLCSRASKNLNQTEKLSEWLKEILIKNEDTKKDYKLQFPKFLEAIVRLSAHVWKDSNSIAEQINKMHYITL